LVRRLLSWVYLNGRFEAAKQREKSTRELPDPISGAVGSPVICSIFADRDSTICIVLFRSHFLCYDQTPSYESSLVALNIAKLIRFVKFTGRRQAKESDSLFYVGWELAGQRSGTGLEANGEYKSVPFLATSTVCFTTVKLFDRPVQVLLVYLRASALKRVGTTLFINTPM
jgi:hypothetical protein